LVARGKAADVGRCGDGEVLYEHARGLVTLPTGVGSVLTCKLVEAGRSLETEPSPVWARRRSRNRFGPPECQSDGPARWGGEVGQRGRRGEP